MKFALSDVARWHTDVACVPTALSAVSGCEVADVIDQLVRAASDRGEIAARDRSASFNINDWLQVICNVGGNWRQIENYSAYPYQARMPISEYLKRAPFSSVRLVFGENADGSETHVFAASGSQLVDTYTEGRVAAVSPELVPADYDDFRIKRVFSISPI